MSEALGSEFLAWTLKTSDKGSTQSPQIWKTSLTGPMLVSWPTRFPSNVVHLGRGSLNTEHGSDVDKVMRYAQGIVWGMESPNQWVVITDRYGTLPTYIFKSASELALFTRFDSFIQNVRPHLTLDRTGFWELLLLDGALSGRTLFNEIRQLPPASIIRIDLDKWEVTSERYYNMNFPLNNLTDPVEIGEQTATLLQKSLSRVSHGERYLLPLSGGIDSRLIAASMTKIVDPDRIRSITFASNKSSYENTLAKKVCQILGIRQHEFFELTPATYKRALPFFSEKEAGRLSIAHSHLYNAVTQDNEDWTKYTLLSGMFADAIAGYAASPNPESNMMASTLYHRVIAWSNRLTLSDVVSSISEDINEIFAGWQQGSTISSFNEYVYLTQRQQALLFPLVEIYSRYLPVYMPYTDPDLADFLLGLPYQMREFKNGIRSAIKYQSPTLAHLRDLSSKHLRNGWKDQLYFGLFRASNYATIAMSLLSRDRLNLVDPFQTEVQGLNLRTYHYTLLKNATNELCTMGILSDNQAYLLGSKHYHAYWFTPQYRVITLSATLKYLQSTGTLSV